MQIFSPMPHESFVLPITQCLKSPQAQLFFWLDMLLDLPFVTDWNNIGRNSKHQTDCNTACDSNTRDKWDYRICDKVVKKMVFSTNHKAYMTVIIGLSQRFIQMEQSGFKVEQNLYNLILTKISHICVTQIPPSPTNNTLTFVSGVDTFNTCSLSWVYVLLLSFWALPLMLQSWGRVT